MAWYRTGGGKPVEFEETGPKELWKFTGHTNWVHAVAVDTSGNVYSGSDDNTVRKISSSGSQVWSFTGHTGTVFAVAVDASGNAYSGGADNTVRKIRYITALGTFYEKSNPVPKNVYKLETKLEEIAGGQPSELWKFTGHTNDVRAVAVDAGGNVYSGSADKTVRKIKNNMNAYKLAYYEDI